MWNAIRRVLDRKLSCRLAPIRCPAGDDRTHGSARQSHVVDEIGAHGVARLGEFDPVGIENEAEAAVVTIDLDNGVVLAEVGLQKIGDGLTARAIVRSASTMMASGSDSGHSGHFLTMTELGMSGHMNSH